MPLIKTRYDIVGTVNKEESAQMLIDSIVSNISKHFGIEFTKRLSGTTTHIESTLFPKSIRFILGTSTNLELTISPLGNGGNKITFPLIDGVYECTYYTYTSSNMIIISVEMRNDTLPAFNNNLTLIAKDKVNNLYYAYSADGSSYRHEMLTTGNVMSYITLPSPKTSQCFSVNNVFGNTMSDIFKSIKCNPVFTKHQEVIVSGYEYFITNTDVAIRLE